MQNTSANKKPKGRPKVEKKKVTISLRITPDLLRYIDKYCDQMHIKRGSFIEYAVAKLVLSDLNSQSVPSANFSNSGD